MDTLRRKFEEHSDVILHELDVSKELLARMTKAGLVDIADCVRIKNLSTERARNHAVISGLLDRRTDQAYPLLLDCLRHSGQTRVADLLTDISAEVLLLSNLQGKLAEEIGRMEGFLRSEESRTKLVKKRERDADDDGALNGRLAHSTPTSDREVWLAIQESMRKAINQFERSKAVITKLHNDCEEVAKTNSDVVAKARDCDRRMREILQQERGLKMAGSIPSTTGELFECLVADAEAMLKIKSRTMTREGEGRTQAMRLLRTARDWVDERCSILNAFHSRMSPTGNPRFPGTSRSTLNASLESEVGAGVDVQAISTVLEGLQLLEQKLRDYIHLEILLTDKFRAELRLKQAMRKSRGFSPRGFKDIQEVVANVEDGDNVTENAQKLRRALDVIAAEYDECTRFLDKVTAAMPFPVPKTKEDLLDELEERKAKEKKKERFGSILSLFRKSPTPSNDKGLATHDKLRLGSDQAMKLPRLAPPGGGGQGQGHGQGRDSKQEINRKNLLGKLQVLAENYQTLRQRQQRLSLRYAREVARRKREADDSVRRKDDAIVQLQIRVRELEAEKEKYKRLYEQTKVSYGRNAGER